LGNQRNDIGGGHSGVAVDVARARSSGRLGKQGGNQRGNVESVHLSVAVDVTNRNGLRAPAPDAP